LIRLLGEKVHIAEQVELVMMAVGDA